LRPVKVKTRCQGQVSPLWAGRIVQDEVTAAKLKKAIGEKVEIHAFGISYVGILKKMNARTGEVWIEDREDYVILEIERIDHFRILRP
jgi:hypothetical protein